MASDGPSTSSPVKANLLDRTVLVLEGHKAAGSASVRQYRHHRLGGPFPSTVAEGFDAYMRKPIDIDKFCTVAVALGQR